MESDFYHIDKTVISKSSFDDKNDEKTFWLSKSPQDRISALEFGRQTLYGYNPVTVRLQRVLTLVEQTWS